MKILVWIFVLLLNTFSCERDWCGVVDHRSAGNCVFDAVEVWRYQKPWTMVIDKDINERCD